MDFAKKRNKRLPNLMEDGDLVVIYERHDALDHFYIQKGQIFQNKFGAFHHADFIGKPFGSKIFSRSASKWIYALEPTPELWNAAVHVGRRKNS
jgi:tRNA (adenine57-N1/adenine58-N1)-methyltransferase